MWQELILIQSQSQRNKQVMVRGEELLPNMDETPLPHANSH